MLAYRGEDLPVQSCGLAGKSLQRVYLPKLLWHLLPTSHKPTPAQGHHLTYALTLIARPKKSGYIVFSFAFNAASAIAGVRAANPACTLSILISSNVTKANALSTRLTAISYKSTTLPAA